jgi:predicted RNA-binding protein YlqC (UPF0109 family)
MASPREVLEFVAKNIVDDPDAVRVEEETDSRGAILHLTVADDDIGKVIGKGGRTARAIRSVVRASAIRAGTHVMVEIAG